MKLIVLYGDENSGKTITLKMVYERLKKENLLETHCFKYYDDDCKHNDFRDVLVLKKKEINDESVIDNNSDVHWYDGTNRKTIEDVFPDADDINSISFDESDEIIEDCDSIEINKNDIELEFNNDSNYNEEYIKEKINSAYLLQKPNLSELISNTSNLNVERLKLIGLSLEGDYGFTHDKSYRSSWTLHNRNLYDNLKELLFCDTIICACSILKDRKSHTLITDPKKKPVNCIVKFLHDFAISYHIKFCVLKSSKHGKDDWKPKLDDNMNNVDKIVNLV